MDGALVIASDGEILAAGAIIKVPGGSDGGGRLAAALELRNLGVGIKISQDGPILGFHLTKREDAKGKVIPKFIVG